VTIHLDGVLYVRIVDAYAASYGVEDPEFAVSQLAQTTMRSELGAAATRFSTSKQDFAHIAF
jgi:regulator of protease activity HflC (stomatin/prohibitin superfamily)